MHTVYRMCYHMFLYIMHTFLPRNVFDQAGWVLYTRTLEKKVYIIPVW
jgi:hypothetical protein